MSAILMIDEISEALFDRQFAAIVLFSLLGLAASLALAGASSSEALASVFLIAG